MSDMARYIDADKVMEEIASTGGHNLCEWSTLGVKALIDRQPTADVAPRAEVFEGVDKFRSDLMNKFIDLCRGNDYNKLTLLKIGDIVDQIYDKQIDELKKKYTQPEPPEES